MSESLASGTGCISFQVVQETLTVPIRRLGVGSGDARRVLYDVIVPLGQVNPTTALYQTSMSLQDRHGFSFHDSLIVAGALEAGCRRL